MRVYKCPLCGATGPAILYTKVTSDEVTVTFNLETNKYEFTVGDWEYVNGYECCECYESLEDSPDEYIINVEE